MIKKPVTIRNSMDMETRPIAHLVQEASQYKSQVYIEIDDKKINAEYYGNDEPESFRRNGDYCCSRRRG